jgi:hypothetical protein
LALTLDWGLQYKSGTAAAVRSGLAGRNARAFPGVARPCGRSRAGTTRTAVASQIDATTPFTDGGWTAQ